MKQSDRRETRQRLATEAARLLAESGHADEGDIDRARRAAAARLGNRDHADWPDDEQIGDALRDHLRLFEPDSASRLRVQRETALRAMRAFDTFQPRLSGWLANGIGLPDMPIELLLKADTAELVMIALMEQNIQFRELEHPLHFADRSRYQAPSFRFLAGDQAVELIVIDERHQRKGAPVDRHSRKPRPRVTRKALEALLDQRSEIGT